MEECSVLEVWHLRNWHLDSADHRISGKIFVLDFQEEELSMPVVDGKGKRLVPNRFLSTIGIHLSLFFLVAVGCHPNAAVRVLRNFRRTTQKTCKFHNQIQY